MTRTGIIFIALAASVVLFYAVGRLLSSYRYFERRVDMKELLSASIDVARRGGDRVRTIREDPRQMKERVKGETKEGAKEMLTAADLESHRIMYGGLSKAFPNMKIISEEHDDSSPRTEPYQPEMSLPEVSSLDFDITVPLSDITVWIDPLDSTQEFTENLTEYVTTMVCIAVKGKPVIGVVHQPFTHETTWAYVGHALSKNLQSLKDIDQRSDLKKIIVSRSHAGDVQNFITSSKSFGENIEIIPAGGAGYKTLQVLHDKVDAYVHVTAIKKWDICAADALMSATNGQMTTLKDAVINYSTPHKVADSSNGVVNSNGLLVTRHLARKRRNAFVEEFSMWMLRRKPAKKSG